MPDDLVHTVIHASDPHLWFRSDPFSSSIAVVDPVNDGLFDFVGDELWEAAHWPSLEFLSREIERRLRSSAATTCIFSGDLCTEPLSAPALAQAYEFFSGVIRHREYEVGLPPAFRDRVALLLGNHDTFFYWRTGHFAGSPFAAHAAGVVPPLRIRSIPTVPGQRQIVVFMVRTDWLGPAGWFGPLPIADDWWDAEALLYAAHRLLCAGSLPGIDMAGAAYESALKILVVHHTPLERDLYSSLENRRFEYSSLQLFGRKRLRRVVAALGIHLVLFGHTHEQVIHPENGTVFADAGTASAARPKDLVRGFTHAFNVFELTVQDRLVVRQFQATRRTRAFVECRVDTFTVTDHGIV